MRLEPVRQEATSIHICLSLAVGSLLSVVPAELCATRKKIGTYPRGRWMQEPTCSNLAPLWGCLHSLALATARCLLEAVNP